MAKPHESHWNATKAVLRYLKGTLDYGIKYTDASDVELTGYSDSDWDGNLLRTKHQYSIEKPQEKYSTP
jgi:hypothetical protein